MSSNSKVCIVGTGYVGMASAIGFATLGHQVLGYDINLERVRALQRGVTPYQEAGIDDALEPLLASGRIQFFEELKPAVEDADFIIVCVGTPSQADGSADLSYVESAVAAIMPLRKKHSVLVMRSTVPAGTTEQLVAKTSVEFVYAPEFLREGSAVPDFLNPDRIVVGAMSQERGLRYASLLASLDRPVLVTSYRDAELIKGFSNAFLALKISFANEVANMCDALDADAAAVLSGVGHDTRIGKKFLQPGIGYGGPCFDKDVKSLHHVAGELGVGRELLGATLRVNRSQPKRIVDLLEEEVGDLSGARIAVWGLAFKAGTDDVRDSLTTTIIEDIIARGGRPVAYDPAVRSISVENCELASSAVEAISHADALLVLTEWPEFAEIAPWAIAGHLRNRIVIDGRNIFDPNSMASAGIRYRGVGRKPNTANHLAAVS